MLSDFMLNLINKEYLVHSLKLPNFCQREVQGMDMGDVFEYTLNLAEIFLRCFVFNWDIQMELPKKWDHNWG